MKLRRLTIALALAMGTTMGCGAEIGDGEGDIALPNGKADSAFSDCELNAVVDFLNDEATSASTLKDYGVHSAAAERIPSARPFADIEAVDAVPYVGPRALEQLVDAVNERGACDVTPPPPVDNGDVQIEVIMSPQTHENSHLARAAQLIDGAEVSVDLAMYSFSDRGIQDALERAVNRGVQVRAILEAAREDKSDPAGTLSSRLEDMGIDVRYVNKIMHHKFLLVDGPTETAEQAAGTRLLTGSGNFSNSAGTRYDENTLVIKGSAELALRYQREFNHMWRNSRDFVWNENLQFRETMPIDVASIPDAPEVDAVFTSDNFRTYVSSAHGNTFSAIRGLNTVANRWVDLIEKAEDSILIASGHLRSRPISEAIMRRLEEQPSLRVEVLLDGQEYISDWYHNSQLSDLESCVEEATTDARRQDCYDTGFYFGYQLGAESRAHVRYKYYSYRWHYTTAEQMHHKYMVVDGRWVVTGSYNLSDNAEHNTLENVAILDGERFPRVVEAYLENFARLWEMNRDSGDYEALLADVNEGTDPFPIVFEPMALEWDEVTTLKSDMRDHCEAINSEAYRQDPGRFRSCDPEE